LLSGGHSSSPVDAGSPAVSADGNTFTAATWERVEFK
jgi:hypothetical protein